MSHKSPLQRAYGYLLTGAVAIQAVQGERVRATVRVAGGGIRNVTRGPDGWTCTCPRAREECAHLLAVRCVVPVDLR